MSDLHLKNGSFSFGDFDGNGDGIVDMVIGGEDDSGVTSISVVKDVYTHLTGAPPDQLAADIPDLGTLTASVSVRNVTFSWQSAVGYPNIATYELQVATSDFSTTPSSFVVAGLVGSPLLGNYVRATPIDGHLQVQLSLTENTSYYWQVRAVAPSFKSRRFCISRQPRVGGSGSAHGDSATERRPGGTGGPFLGGPKRRPFRLGQ